MSKVGEFYRELAERRLKARVSPMFEEIEGPQHPDEMKVKKHNRRKMPHPFGFEYKKEQ